MPEQPPPLQPVNLEPKSAAAVREIAVPLAKFFEQLLLHFAPPGFTVTVPLPPPRVVTVSANHGTGEAFSSTLTPVPFSLVTARSGLRSRLKSALTKAAGDVPPVV